MDLRERVGTLVDGDYEELLPSPHGSHVFAKAKVSGRVVYVSASKDAPPEPFPNPPPRSPVREQPKSRYYASEVRRDCELYELVAADPHPLVYLAKGWMPPTLSQLPVPGLEVGFHRTHGYGGSAARLARLRVPKLAALLGDLASVQALTLGQYDAVVGVRGANVAMVHPGAVKFLTGRDEDLSYALAESLQKAGVLDVVVDDDASAIAWLRRALAALNPEAPWTAPAQRYATVIPQSTKRAFDVHKAVAEFVDDTSFVELRSGGNGGEVVAGLARLEGRPIAVLAHNTMVRAATMHIEGVRKIATFASLADRLGLPLVCLVDSNGLGIGIAAEAGGLFKAAGEAIGTIARATVPKICVILRRGVTGALHTMAGPGIGDRLLVMPSATPAALAHPRVNAMLSSGKLSDDEAFVCREAIDETGIERMLASGYVDAIVRDNDLRGSVLAAIRDVEATR